MRAFAVSAHRRNYTLGQIVPAEHIGLELGAEHVTPDVFQRTRLAVAAIVERRVEFAVRPRVHARRLQRSSPAPHSRDRSSRPRPHP